MFRKISSFYLFNKNFKEKIFVQMTVWDKNISLLYYKRSVKPSVMLKVSNIIKCIIRTLYIVLKLFIGFILNI